MTNKLPIVVVLPYVHLTYAHSTKCWFTLMVSKQMHDKLYYIQPCNFVFKNRQPLEWHPDMLEFNTISWTWMNTVKTAHPKVRGFWVGMYTYLNHSTSTALIGILRYLLQISLFLSITQKGCWIFVIVEDCIFTSSVSLHRIGIVLTLC